MPGFYGSQGERLLRRAWRSDVDSFAKELYAMWKEPIQTDQTITIYRTDPDQPAIRIIDTTGGDTPPIVIRNGPDGDDEPFDPSGGGGGGGGGSSPTGGKDKAPKPKPPAPTGGGSIGTATPPSPTVGYLFTANLRVQIIEPPPDRAGFNGLQPIFTATECKPYKPPLANKPTTAFAFAGILDALNRYISQNGLTGQYFVITDTVSDPSPSPCTLPPPV